MFEVKQVKLPVTHTKEELYSKTARLLKVNPKDIDGLQILKRSVDARKKDQISFVYNLAVSLKAKVKLHHKIKQQTPQYKEASYCFPKHGSQELSHPPVVVGSGPAGLFCAYMLAQEGYRPILIEQGDPASERKRKVDRFWSTGLLDPDSNVQFGEGGAGTFSDGKLNTGIKDSNHRNRKVLELFVAAGGPEEILYDARPHLGTDLLVSIVENLREEIISMGGTVRFRTKLTDLILKHDHLEGIQLNGEEVLPCDCLVLAIGHSARDTFHMLYRNQLSMRAKSFAVGVRIEHPEALITESQYGENPPEILGAANYKLARTKPDGRGVYSFCMCPGGYVVNASSEEKMLAVNGMSYHGRKGSNSNAAIVVTVDPADFMAETSDMKIPEVLRGLAFQRKLEQKAFQLCDGAVPVQRFEDFCQGKAGNAGSFAPAIKGAYDYGNVASIFSDDIYENLKEGILSFDSKIHSFAMPDACISGVESRTSSPIRIDRDESFQSSIQGIFPCGEGAGYAGGITSAAMDGLKVAEAIGRSYKSLC